MAKIKQKNTHNDVTKRDSSPKNENACHFKLICLLSFFWGTQKEDL